MTDPYLTVLTSVILSIILLIAILLYRFIYPRKTIAPVVYVILVSLLPLFSMLRPGTYESGSLSDYVKFSYSFFSSLTEGNIIPRWDAYRCAGYGCPQFIYMYIFPYYVISAFHIFGVTFINSIKSLLAISYVMSGLGMYFFLKNLVNKKTALAGSIFYLYAPYHLSDLHFSSDIGEMVAFALLPFLFMLIKFTIDKGKFYYSVITGFILSFLLLSHHVVFMATAPLLLIFGIIYWKSVKKIYNLHRLAFVFVSYICCVLFSMFYWLPIYSESDLIYWGRYGTVSFVEPIYYFFISIWRYGFLYQGPTGQLSFIMGYLHIILFFVAVGILLKRMYARKTLLKSHILLSFFVISTLVYFFLLLPYSQIIWLRVPLMEKFQFSYRFLIIIAFLSSAIAGLILGRVKNNTIFSLILAATIIITILNWGNRRAIPEIDDDYLIYELMHRENVFQLTIPNTAQYKNMDLESRPVDAAMITQGKGELRMIKDNTSRHEFIVSASTPVTLKENTFYYPGWNVYVNDKPYLFTTNHASQSGLLYISLPQGLHRVDVKFENTPIRTFGDIISGVSIFLGIAYLSIYGFIKINVNKLMSFSPKKRYKYFSHNK